MKRKGPRRDAQKERFWRRAVRRQPRSGQSVREFCRANGLSEPSFYAWRRELGRRSKGAASRRGRATAARASRRRAAAAGAAFVPVRVAAEMDHPRGAAAVEMALPSGAVLRWPAPVDPAAVAAVVSAWERSRC